MRGVLDAVSRLMAGAPFLVPLIKRCARADFICLNYHLVSDAPNGLLGNRFPFLSSKAFESDMDWLLKRYPPMALSDVLRHINETGRLPPRGFVITFDDGHSECHDVAAPILSRKGIPAAFFLCTRSIDNKEILFPHKKNILLGVLRSRAGQQDGAALAGPGAEGGRAALDAAVCAAGCSQTRFLDDVARRLEVDFDAVLQRDRPYLSAGQVRALIGGGFEIGSHGIEHALLAEWPAEEQVRHIVESTREIRGRFALGYGFFAFPYSELGVPDEVHRAALASGVVDLLLGTRGGARDEIVRCIQRTGVETKRGGTAARFFKTYYDMTRDRWQGRGVVMRR